MICPYCEQEMQLGVVSGDGRSRVYFHSGQKPGSFWERLKGSNQLTAAEYSLARFTLKADYCQSCKKLIIDTDLTR